MRMKSGELGTAQVYNGARFIRATLRVEGRESPLLLIISLICYIPVEIL